MDAIWAVVASNAVIVTLMALAVTLVGRVWKNPHALHFLWVVVLVKLLLPPLVTVSLPLLSREASFATTDVAPLASDASAPLRDPGPTHPGIGPDALSNPSLLAAAAAAPWRAHVSLARVAACVWFAGSAGFAIVYGLAILRFRKVLRHARPASQEIATMAEALCKQLGLRRTPGIVVLPIRISPLVWAVGYKACVVLPAELCQRLDAPALRSILAHELAHVKRKDHFVRLLELVASIVFWWHPLTWWAARQLRELEEECCDAIVVAGASCDTRCYATALVDTLEYLSNGPALLPRAATAARPVVSLSRRIRMLPAHAHGKLRTRSHALLLAAVAAFPVALAFNVIEADEPFANPPTVADAPRPAAETAATELHGTVVDAKHQPVAGAQVFLVGDLSGGKAFHSLARAIADEHGKYTLDVLPDNGQHWKTASTGTLWAYAKGHALGMLSVHSATSYEGVDFAIKLGPLKVTELLFRDPAGNPLAGTVERMDIGNVDLPREFLAIFPSQIDRGRLKLDAFPIDADTPDPRSISIRTASLGLQQFTWWHAAEPAPREVDQWMAGIDRRIALTARPLATIEGRIYGEKGPLAADVLANLEVTLETLHGNTSPRPDESWTRGYATARTDADGRFEVQLAAGKLISVRANLPKEAKLRVLLPPEKIVLEPGATQSLHIPLVATRTLRGVVRTPSGEPAAMGFSIAHGNMVRENRGNHILTTAAFHEKFYTDAEGRFAHEVVPGEVTLTRFVAPGSNMGSGGLWPHSLAPDSLLQVREASEPFDLPPITLHQLSGRVVDAKGQPVTTGLLVLATGDTFAGIAGIDSNGNFRCECTFLPERATVANGQSDAHNPFGKSVEAAIMSKSPLVVQLPPVAESDP